MRGDDSKHRDENENGVMTWKHGMSVSEIACVMGISESCVRVLLFTAMVKLRRQKNRLAALYDIGI